MNSPDYYEKIALDMWYLRNRNYNLPDELLQRILSINRMAKIYNGSQGDNELSMMETIATIIECYCMKEGL